MQSIGIERGFPDLHGTSVYVRKEHTPHSMSNKTYECT